MNEEDIFSTNKTHLGRLQDPMVCVAVNENNQIFEPNSKLIDSLLAEISTKEQEIHFYNENQQQNTNC